MNKIKLALLTVFLISVSAGSSHAVITAQDSTLRVVDDELGFAQVSDIESPNGEVGDFMIMTCGLNNEGQDITFLPATPGWTTQNQDDCGQENCFLGLFTRFSDSTGGENNNCSWDELVTLFAGGILRYSGVDPENPIIDFECQSGTTDPAVAPSIITEDNSAVIRIFLVNGIVETFDFDFGTFAGQASNEGEFLSTNAFGQPFEEGGETGTFEAGIQSQSWRACTMALRMGAGPPSVRNVPTLSEWGLIAMAGALGIVGLLAVRRRMAEV